MDNNTKPSKRRNKFAGKEDISRETADNILSEQIDQLREISGTTNQTAGKVRESVAILYEKRIPIDTEKFEHLNRHFIAQMEHKLRKVKQPSRGLKWYIAMWIILSYPHSSPGITSRRPRNGNRMRLTGTMSGE